MKNIISILLLFFAYAPQLSGEANRIVKPIGGSYQIYQECLNEAAQSLHPSYKLHDNKDYIMDAVDLLVWWRFDIIAKYIYAKNRELKVKSSWHKDLYIEHEKVWSSCQEWDGSKKDCPSFVSSFDQTIDSIKKNGFDAKKGKIRLDISKYPCDGSHRIASCILFKKKVACRHVPEKQHATYSSAVFFKHFTKFVPTGLSEKYLDAMALEYCKLKTNTRLMVVPSVENIEAIRKIIRAFGAIVYEKKCSLTKRGLNNLFEFIPEGIGNKPEDISNISTIHVFLCEFDKPHIQILQSIMSVLSKDPLFILSPDHASALEIAQMLLVNNSINFLNRRKRADFQGFQTHLLRLEKIIAANKLIKDQMCITGGGTQAAYGNQDCHNLSVEYHARPKIDSFEIDKIKVHVSNKFDDLIFNPTNHFYFRGFKFAYSAK